MNLFRRVCVVVSTSLLPASLAVGQQPVKTQLSSSSKIQHVLLISVDGMHAVDFLNCANGIVTANGGQPFCPAIAALGSTGVNYLSASTSKPRAFYKQLRDYENGDESYFNVFT